MATPAVQAITPSDMPMNMMPDCTTFNTFRLDRKRYSADCGCVVCARKGAAAAAAMQQEGV